MDHGPHPSGAHDTSMESLARLIDLCQTAAPVVAAPTGLGGVRKVSPSPMTHVFPPTCPAFRTLIHLISRMAKPITSIPWIVLRSVMSTPLPPLAASLGTPRLQAPIVSLSSNSMTRHDPVRLTPLQRTSYSHSPAPWSSLLVDDLAPMVTSMECIRSPYPTSATPR